MDALLSLGGNVGDRKATIDAAIARLAALPGTAVTARSSYYRTEPVGPVVQDWFLNIGAALRTAFNPASLANACRLIEIELGRDRGKEIPWGPRPVDIDVIATGDEHSMMPAGERLDDRAFVLIPLAEIAPTVHIEGSALAERIATIGGRGVEKLDWPVPPA